MADVGLVVEALLDLFSRSGPRCPPTPATVFVDDEWVQGELVHEKDRLTWRAPGRWKVITFEPDDGFVEVVEDEAGEDHVVLHFRRADDVLHLAVPREDLGIVSAVLPLPAQEVDDVGTG